MEKIPLWLHGQEVDSIFQLLGTKENDITYSLGWGFTRAPHFARQFVRDLFKDDSLTVLEVLLQEHQTARGFTDVELIGEGKSGLFRVVIEAKRGYSVPSPDQLIKYENRFKDIETLRSFLVLAEAREDYARRALGLPYDLNGIPICYQSWTEVWRKVAKARATKGVTHAEKRILMELETYMRKLATLQNQDSNLVTVVSLSRASALGSPLSFLNAPTT
jgi:hypothetical protein